MRSISFEFNQYCSHKRLIFESITSLVGFENTN